MIVTHLEEFNWGTAEVPGFPNARRLNMMDPDSKLRFTTVFSDTPLKDLIAEMALGLTPEQAAELLPQLEERSKDDPEKFVVPQEPEPSVAGEEVQGG